MVDKRRHVTTEAHMEADATAAPSSKAQQLELLEVISSEERATAATQPLTPIASHSWSLSSNSILMNHLAEEEDKGNDHASHWDGAHEPESVDPLRAKAILSYSSDSSGLFSPLYEVTSEHTNVFQSTRKPLPKPGKTPRFGNLTYKQGSKNSNDDSLKTARTSNTTNDQKFRATADAELSFDFSAEPESCRRDPPRCGSSVLCDAMMEPKQTPAKSTIISPVRTFEAFIRGEWQLERVASISSRSSSTEAIVPDFVDMQDENTRDDWVTRRHKVDSIRDEVEEEEDLILDPILQVKDSIDADGNDVIVISEICPETPDNNEIVCSSGRFGVDLGALQQKQLEKPVIDLTCCTDSEAMSFKMLRGSKYEQILSAQRHLSFLETPSSLLYNLLSDTSRHLKWDRNALLEQLSSSKYPLLVLSEHFRDMNQSCTERRGTQSPNHHLPIPVDLCQNINRRFRGWSLQRSRKGMLLVYQHPEDSEVDNEGHGGSCTSTELATACSTNSADSNQSRDSPSGQRDDADDDSILDQHKEATDDSVLDSEVINDTDLRAVMNITNNGEDVSLIFPSVSFDTIPEEESDDGLGSEMNALLDLQTQLQSAMDVAATLTPSRFSIELTSPFAENLYSKDSSMASFGVVDDSDSSKESQCKRGTFRPPRRRVQFNDDVQEFLYVSEISDELPNRRSYRKRSFVGEFIGICEDVAEELSLSCVALSNVCSGRPRPKKTQTAQRIRKTSTKM